MKSQSSIKKRASWRSKELSTIFHPWWTGASTVQATWRKWRRLILRNNSAIQSLTYKLVTNSSTVSWVVQRRLNFLKLSICHCSTLTMRIWTKTSRRQATPWLSWRLEQELTELMQIWSRRRSQEHFSEELQFKLSALPWDLHSWLLFW